MEINKQLFENVLSGKLKGTFVLRNGFRINSNRLCKQVENTICPYWLKGFSPLYTREGIPNSTFMEDYTIVDFIPKPKYKTIDLEMLEYCRKDFDFIKTLSKAINNMNTLEIVIPPDKEIDWKESEKQNKIVLKDKQLTYSDICRKLFVGYGLVSAYKNYIPSKELAEAFLAMMQLMSLRQARIGNWEPDWSCGYSSNYCIIGSGDDFEVCNLSKCRYALSFPTQEMAVDFMNCFKDLLEVAKPLI